MTVMVSFFSIILATYFVSFADVVQFVNRSTVSWVAHRSIAENEAVAAISPVLSLVKVGHVVKGKELQVFVSSQVNASFLNFSLLSFGRPLRKSGTKQG